MAFIVLKQRPGAMPPELAMPVVDVKRVEPDSASPGDCVVFFYGTAAGCMSVRILSSFWEYSPMP